MTYGLANIAGVALATPITVLPGWARWPSWAQTLWTFAVGAHLSHALDFSAALLFLLVVWPAALAGAGVAPPAAPGGVFASLARPAAWLDLSPTGWVAQVFGFNLACMVVLVGFWHWMTYGGGVTEKDEANGPMAKFKFNPEMQYGPKARAAGDNHLRREVFLQTLGWLQAAALQVAFARLYATGAIGSLGGAHFWAGLGGAWPASTQQLLATLATPETRWNIASVLLVTYWREIHFYWCHRMIHPWTGLQGSQAPWWDLGAVLYTHAHSWHHKSRNPGPWSGMSMHPVEHFFYFQCAWLPLLAAFVPALAMHPMHFLYAIFHACIAPIAGHDGYASPGGNSDYHYLHHAHFEVNYGVP